MSGIFRANPYLNEIIQILDLHRSKFRTDDEARTYLSNADNKWIDDEYVHCMIDTRYFVSNYFFYRDETEGFKGLYPLFDSQEIMHDAFRDLEKRFGKVRALVLKARQMGYTTYMIGEFLHKTVFWKHTNAIMVSQDEKGANYNMGMYESAFDFLPWWMKPRINLHQTGVLYNFDEPDETLRMSRPGLKNWVFADNANRPSGVGRGMTFRRALLDELAFWKNSSQLSKALLRTMNASDGFYVMGSTANGRNDAWHNLWRKAESGAIDWHPVFIPFYRRAKTYSIPITVGIKFTLTSEEAEMRERVLKLESFKISDETFNWMRKTKEEFVATDGDDTLFAQEYTSTPEESFQSSAITAFPRRIINTHAKHVSNPKWIGEISYDFNEARPKLHMRECGEKEHLSYPENDDRFHVWEKPQKGYEYCVGVDVSLGNPGGDYSACQVLKKPKGMDCDEQVAVWHGLVNPTALAEIVLAICWWYNEAMAAIEVNGYGMQTNSVLMRNYEYDNLYRYKRLDRITHSITNIVGFYSTQSSTDAYMARMSEGFLEDTVILNDKFTVDEFYDYTEEGAVGEGAHDDLADAWMIALYCAHEAEVRDRQEGKRKEKGGTNLFIVKDRLGKIAYQGTSQSEAIRVARKSIGSQIVRRAGATADLQIGKRTVAIPADFYNTDYSPIHDDEGAHHQLYEDGMAPEDITPEAVLEYEANMETENEDDPRAWMAE